MAEKTSDGWQAREYHKLAIGGVLFQLAFRADDANALEALLRMPVAEFRKLRLATSSGETLSLAQVLRGVIDEHSETLDARGRAHILSRRRDAYLGDAESWKKDGDQAADASWRAKYMTKGQRHLIHQLCIAKGVAPPEGLNRGTAHEWLEANSAHHIYSEE